MIFTPRSAGFFFLILTCSLFLAGCASKLPLSIPLKRYEREHVLDLYQSLLNRDCEKPIDADVSFEMKTFGSHHWAAGFLQIQPPSSLRTTIVDPVGRPIFILVFTGETITLADSVKGRGVVGSLESITKQEGIPLYLKPDEVISLLQGRLTPDASYLIDARKDTQISELVWLIFSSHKDNRHNILFAPEARRIERYVIENRSGNIILDMYFTWNDAVEEECSMPLKIKMKGSFFQGEVILKYDLVLLDADIPNNVFELTLPGHYNIKYLE